MEQFLYGNADAANVLIQMVDEHDLASIENEYEEIKSRTKADFCLKAVKVKSWNKDLSPWEAKAVFGREDFGFGARQTLDEILTLCGDRQKKYFIGGYSLAGLSLCGQPTRLKYLTELQRLHLLSGFQDLPSICLKEVVWHL